MNDKFPNFQLPEIDLDGVISDIQNLHRNTALHEENQREMQNMLASQVHLRHEKEEARITREEKQIELLEGIKNNTGSLVNMVDMIRFNSDQQTEIMIIIADILKIGTAATQEEADNIYKDTLTKINTTIETGENVAKLTTWATTVWQLMQVLS